MTGVERTAPSQGSPTPTPTPTSPASGRELRPLAHRAPNSDDTVLPTAQKIAPVRPALATRPSVSAFVTTLAPTRTGHKYAVQGNCLQCMAAMRDAYDKMHAQHVKVEAEASGR